MVMQLLTALQLEKTALIGYELRACVDSIATTQITEDPSVRSSSSVCSPCIYFRLLQQNFRLPNPCNDPHATAIRVQIIGIFPLSVTRPKNFIMADPWKAKPNFFHSPFDVLTARQRVKLRGTQTPPTPQKIMRFTYI
jgi:hypothetical protein